MPNDDEAKIAIAGLNGEDFHGSQLNIEVSCIPIIGAYNFVQCFLCISIVT